jgi:hypothetical protein
MDPPRSTAQRRAGVLEKLRTEPGTEKDVWVASASASGEAHLIPLSYYWDGARLTVATPKRSRTARNLHRAGVARMALPATRDLVVIIEGTLEFIPAGEDDELAVAHTATAGFDARRTRGEYVYIRMTPRKIQAWGGENELIGRDVMVDGRWLAS